MEAKKTACPHGINGLSFGRTYDAVKRFIWVVPPLIVLLAMLAVFRANGLYPFGEKTISWCDMDQQVVPLLLTFKDVLEGKEGFFFNMNHASGMNFFGVFFFFLSSPFTFLVAFVDKADMLSFANVLVVLKMCAIAGTASYYLYTRSGDAPLLNVVLSVLTAVSGYVMMYYQNVIWLDMVCVFPLLLLGLDKLKDGKRLMFTVVLVACLFINYYLSYMIVIFLLLYAAAWVIISKNLRFAGDFVVCCLVAALVSSIVWLPSFVQYFSSGRPSSLVQSIKQSAVITTYDTAVPTILSVLFLYPFALLGARRLNGRAVHLAILLALTTVPVLLEPINKMWQTGHYMSFPTRYAFITIFLCVVAAYEGMTGCSQSADNVRFRRFVAEKPVKNILSYVLSGVLVALCVAYLVYVIKYTGANAGVLDEYASTLWGDEKSFAALIAVYSVATAIGMAACLLGRLKLVRPALLYVAVGVIVLSELFISPRIYMVAPAHDVQYYRQVVDLSDRIEDDGFYRVKTASDYSWRDFDANTMGGIGYNALGHYTSLTNGSYMTAMKQMGYTSYWMEVGNSGGTEITDAIMSVGYEITSGGSSSAIYKNEYYSIVPKDGYLPLGIVAAEDIIASTQSGKNVYRDRADHQVTLAAEILGNGDVIKKYNLLEHAVLNGVTVEEGDGLYRLVPDAPGASIKFNVEQSGRYSLYFNVFYKNNNSLRQPINEKFNVSSPRVNAYGFPSQKNNGVLDMGEYNRGSSVTVRFNSPVTVSEMSVFTIDLNALDDALEGTRTVGLKEKRNGLVGKAEGEGGESVFLSVAYDSGLRLKINGKRAELFEVYGGFTAFRLEEGENEIKISYVSPGFRAGAAIAAVGIAIMVVVGILQRRRAGGIILPKRASAVCGGAVILAGIAVIVAVYVAPMVLCLM